MQYVADHTVRLQRSTFIQHCLILHIVRSTLSVKAIEPLPLSGMSKSNELRTKYGNKTHTHRFDA